MHLKLIFYPHFGLELTINKHVYCIGTHYIYYLSNSMIHILVKYLRNIKAKNFGSEERWPLFVGLHTSYSYLHSTSLSIQTPILSKDGPSCLLCRPSKNDLSTYTIFSLSKYNHEIFEQPPNTNQYKVLWIWYWSYWSLY